MDERFKRLFTNPPCLRASARTDRRIRFDELMAYKREIDRQRLAQTVAQLRLYAELL